MLSRRSSADTYLFFDIFSRYVVGWMIALRDAAQLAEQLIADALAKNDIALGMLTNQTRPWRYRISNSSCAPFLGRFIEQILRPPFAKIAMTTRP